MPRNPLYMFVPTDTNTLVAALTSEYERLTGVSVLPASPEKLFILWVAAVIIQERVLLNYTGNQNIPSRAEGANLDALGELFRGLDRPSAKPAMSSERFYISAPQPGAILIPALTRVTDISATLVWETTEDVYIAAGDLSADVPIRCQTPGVVGNGYAIGQINTAVDLFAFFSSCENLTVSDGGSDVATDEQYYDLLRLSMDAYSDAGAMGGYIYFAKSVSNEIIDVVANSPSAGQVNIYVLMNGGVPAGQEIKDAVYAACDAKTVRPLTDYVVMDDPETVSYDVDLTYYIPSYSALSSAEIEAAVQSACQEFAAWQSAKLGRDINPSVLVSLLMKTGIKRVEVRQPVFTVLRDGQGPDIPQVAVLGSVNIVNGGFENE